MKFLFLTFLIISWCSATWADKPTNLNLLPSEDPSIAEVRLALQKELQGKGDMVRRSVRRLGNKTISLQAFISIEGSFDIAPKILAGFQKKPGWAIQHINESPTGRNYYFKVLKAESETPDIVSFSFILDLPLYQHKGMRKFKLKSRPGDKNFVLEAQTLPDPESVISSCLAKLYVFPATNDPNRLWIAATGKIEIRPWILYEALPERILTNESTERLETVIANYQKEEDAATASSDEEKNEKK